MALVILFDWFTNESMDAALQATEWQQRDMFLRLALMWGTAAQQCRKEASTETQANSDVGRGAAVAGGGAAPAARRLPGLENRAASFYRPVRAYRTLCNRCGMVSVGCRYSHFGTPPWRRLYDDELICRNQFRF
jgi:hypothetical protein